MALFDSAPEPLRRLINEYNLSAVCQAAEIVGPANFEALERFLQANRRAAQKELLVEAAITPEDAERFLASTR